MISSPCKGCKNRTVECHTICPEFKAWEIVHKEETNSAFLYRLNRSQSYTYKRWKNVKQEARKQTRK